MAVLRRLVSVPYHGPAGEDRWAWTRDRSGRTVYVLCDGASESYDGARWASVLARVLARGLLGGVASKHLRSPHASGEPETHREFINLIRQAQKIYVQQSRLIVPGELEWLNRQALVRGDWSTVLAVGFSSRSAFAELWALGDTMLFLRDGSRFLGSFPLEQEDGRPVHPTLVPSRGVIPSTWITKKLNLKGLAEPRILMVTDALGNYLLERDMKERLELWDFWCRGSRDAVEYWLMNERARFALAADDYTLLELIP